MERDPAVTFIFHQFTVGFYNMYFVHPGLCSLALLLMEESKHRNAVHLGGKG